MFFSYFWFLSRSLKREQKQRRKNFEREDFTSWEQFPICLETLKKKVLKSDSKEIFSLIMCIKMSIS